MRKVVAAVTLAVLVLMGLWFGEDGGGILRIWPWVLGLAVAAGFGLILARRPVWRVLAAALGFVGYAGAFWLGLMSFNAAYSQCLSEGRTVRQWLAEFQQSRGHFPSGLSSLGRPLPCTTRLHGTILEYRRTESGYELAFRDWLVEHRADETRDFMAHK
jgi:hypothetical protein